jgi:arsenite methyltransferase
MSDRSFRFAGRWWYPVVRACAAGDFRYWQRLLREAFRVLKSGGRLAVSDVVTRGEIHPDTRKNILLWVGCVAGALEESEYRTKLKTAGFEGIDVEPTRIYRAEEATSFLQDQGLDVEAISPKMDGKFMSASIRARKPG